MPVQKPNVKPAPGEGSKIGAEATRAGVAPSGKRFYEFETVIDCTPEALWKAISDGAEIAKWFAPEARVEPGLGGKVWLSWGPGWEGTQKIEIWEPGRRMGVNHIRGDESDEAPQAASGGAVPVAVDFIIEGRGGQTVLRIVQSGFGAGSEWDGEVDSICRGWRIFTSQLKHYLEKFSGETAANVWLERCIEGLPNAWRKLIGQSSPLKFERRELWGAPAVGSGFAVSAGGEELTGRIDFFGPSMEVGMVLDEPAQGLMRLSAINYGPWVGLSLYLVGYGESVDKAALRARGERLLDGLVTTLGIAVAPPESHPSYATLKAAQEKASG